jgi:P4 family phage/plasmid primase-like protien
MKANPIHEASPETGANHEIACAEPASDAAPGADRKDLSTSGDTAAAMGFLENWRSGGPWVLTSIVPDGRTTTKTFTGLDESREQLREWIDQLQSRENIYFTVNDVYGSVTSKPNKGAVSAIRALHVDIDPRAGEDLEAERTRALKLLREFTPTPTVIVDSGGGYQGFWLLAKEELVDGNAKLAQLFSRSGQVSEAEQAEVEAHKVRLFNAVEGRNLHAELKLEADACHNADRIMRLPGTVNVPNKKKRAKGRVPALARVVEAEWSRRYRRDDFPAAPRPNAGSAPRSNAGPPSSFGEAMNVDVETLDLPDRVKALIVNGTDPDEPDRWADRSRLVLHVLCEMIRADLPAEVMKAVILDPDLAISAHVREQKGAERYADRQIQRALEQQPRPGPVLHGGAMDWARALRDARRPHLRHHQLEFLEWDGAAYIGVADDTVRAEAWGFLESCRVVDKDGNPQLFRPKPEGVSATIDAMKAVTHLATSREEPPRWLDGRVGPNPLDLLPTRSGLLHLPTGDLLLATPELFTRNALDFSHEPAAPEPRRWLGFLHEAWPGEDEADCITALQEFMGYLLTPDTSLQKALLIPGPKRSGKGTIGRIMGKLVGEANTVAPSLNSFGRSDFGLEPLLAKQLAIVSDMRLSGRTDEAVMVENLLRITGEDRVSVNRKHRQALEVTLRVRFVVMTNEVPRFADRSGALVSRFIVLPMRQSFFGREDTGLTEALITELPGILNWAVEGWRRVRETGRITQPQAGSDIALQMGDLSSPIPAFVRECCELGGEQWVPKERLFAAFREWHRDRMGQDYASSINIFARDLYSAMDGQVRDFKPRDGRDRVRAFGGLSLHPGFETGRRDHEMPF